MFTVSSTFIKIFVWFFIKTQGILILFFHFLVEFENNIFNYKGHFNC